MVPVSMGVGCTRYGRGVHTLVFPLGQGIDPSERTCIPCPGRGKLIAPVDPFMATRAHMQARTHKHAP